ncbi:MAG: helix-turn-helix domain-containing protein [Pseudomonadales bacterium]|jgi:AcrR family transcriptional regulator|nr:helix-turn-helix domain-containing protein [Pseudomonadales bacterium]
MTDGRDRDRRVRRLGVRHPPLQARSEETRDRLLEAALACFLEEGVAASSTARIAERAGVTRGAYLHHFGSREDLIAAAIGHLMAGTMGSIEATIRRLFTEPPAPELLLHVWRDAYPDAYFAGYEMMLLCRHAPRLRRAWKQQSDALARRRRRVLLELFPEPLVDGRVNPFLEGFADFFRGIKLMEVVRTEAETRAVIAAMSPVLLEELRALQSLRGATVDA